jgi:hypothetical protein
MPLEAFVQAFAVQEKMIKQLLESGALSKNNNSEGKPVER